MDASPTEPSTTDRRALYDERLRRFATEGRELDRRDRRLSWSRLATFVLALVLLGVAFWVAADPPTAWYVASAVSFTAFLVLVWLHTALTARQRRVRAHVRLNTEAIHRLDRTWEALDVPTPCGVDPDDPVARDLNVFGRASLYQLLGEPGTRHGRRTLSAWLAKPADPVEIALRHPAVDELATMLDMRHELAWRAGIAGRLDPEPFLEWAEGPSWLSERRWLVWLGRFLPSGLVLSAFAQWAGLVDAPVWGGFLLVNIVLSLVVGERVHGIFEHVASRKGKLSAFERPFAIVDRADFRSVRLVELQRRMRVDGASAESRMRKLSRIVELAGLHHSQMTYMAIQALTLWDLHVLDALDRWQRESGRIARGWLEALGELEALAGLAGLRFDEPSWTFPTVDAATDRIAAEALGHPLIAARRRVANDVTVGPAGSFLLVTGSNMSGKSTMLRAIGLNVVLAQAGGPVCARALAMPPLVLGTSIVIEDSLEDGVSFFMAELRRLRDVVGLADECRGSRRRLLFLLDEILRGTNAVERQIAARHVIAHLIESGAIGAVSTHDTGLAAIEELVRASVPVHFQETIDTGAPGGTMTFDYRLRQGLATTTNALKLLELVGLGSVTERPAPPA